MEAMRDASGSISSRTAFNSCKKEKERRREESKKRRKKEIYFKQNEIKTWWAGKKMKK
jgi:hypothetical protein